MAKAGTNLIQRKTSCVQAACVSLSQLVTALYISMGAVTVHKAFGLGIEFEKYKDAPGFRSSYLQEADVVIID